MLRIPQNNGLAHLHAFTNKAPWSNTKRHGDAQNTSIAMVSGILIPLVFKSKIYKDPKRKDIFMRATNNKQTTLMVERDKAAARTQSSFQ